MTPVAIDASMAMTWCFEDESTPTNGLFPIVSSLTKRPSR
jgi:hypothetical protein